MLNLQAIVDGADHCVKCGLCLPYCPTYHLSGLESESPRGRISLMQAWAGGQISQSNSLNDALNQCLGCYACERVCPAKVEFGQIHDASLYHLEQRQTKYAISAWIKFISLHVILGKKQILNLLLRLVRWYQYSRLNQYRTIQWLLRVTRLAQLEKQCPDLKPIIHWKHFYGSDHGKRQIGLFLGCIGEQIDQQSLQDSIDLLNKLDINVVIPPKQVCCGALYAHHGDGKTAEECAKKNTEAFRQEGVDTIVFTATGCGAYFKNYKSLLKQKSLGMHFIEISRFLLDQTKIEKISFTPLKKNIAIHTACSLKNVLHDEKSIYELIQLIPQANIIPLKENDFCCGAAGSKMLTHREMANRLLEEKMREIIKQQPDYLLTSNIGCALHLRTGCKQHGINLTPMHPVSILRQQWPKESSRSAIK